MTVFSIVLAAIMVIALMALPALSTIGTGLDVDSYRITMNQTPTKLSGVSPHIFDNVTTGPAATARESAGVSPGPGIDFMYRTAMASPGVAGARVVSDMSHVGITIVLNRYADSQDLSAAIRSILLGYAALLQGYPVYFGYLRIGLSESNQIVAIWEADATSTRGATQNNSLAENYINYVLQSGKHWVLVDRYGPIDKTVKTGGGYMSPMVGNWLG